MTLDIFKDVLILILGVVISFLVTWFWRHKSKIELETKESNEKIEKLESQVTVLMTQISPFWAAVQTKIAKDLTHPHEQFKEMDDLLVKLENLTISPKDRGRLLVLLEERIVSEDLQVTQGEKDSAKLMKGVMSKVIKESKGTVEPPKIKDN